MAKFVLPFKKDLDALLAVYLLGVDVEKDELITAPKDEVALQSLLDDPEVYCIEVGGAGQTGKRNFDHSGPKAQKKSACLQAWEYVEKPEKPWLLVEYVNKIDLGGAQTLGERPPVSFTDILAGIILTAQDKKWGNVRLIEESSNLFVVAISEGIDPYTDFSDFVKTYVLFEKYVARKRAEDLAAENAALNILILDLKSGRKLGVLTSNFRGATNSVYRAGADYCLCINPNFLRKGRKVTVGVNVKQNPKGSVVKFLDALNDIEDGAGGHAQVGGSKVGSQVPLMELINLAQQFLK